MKLSILIVNWNTRDLVVKCVNSILKHAPPFAWEAVVVDNGSADGSADVLTNLFGHNKKIKIIQSLRNLGFAKGNNLAYKNCSGEFIFLLNPDAEVTDGALEKLVSYLDGHADAGIVGPTMINPNGTLQSSVRRFPGIWSSLMVFSGLHRFIRQKRYLMDGFDYGREADVDQVMGAALVTRRSIIEKLGFLDENFWLWYEEVDFCRRVKNAGYQVRYYPGATVIHHFGQGFSQIAVYRRKKIAAKSLVYYFKKNGHFWDIFLIRIIMPVVLFAAWVMTGLERTFKFRLKPHAQ